MRGWRTVAIAASAAVLAVAGAVFWTHRPAPIGWAYPALAPSSPKTPPVWSVAKTGPLAGSSRTFSDAELHGLFHAVD